MAACLAASCWDLALWGPSKRDFVQCCHQCLQQMWRMGKVHGLIARHAAEGAANERPVPRQTKKVKDKRSEIHDAIVRTHHFEWIMEAMRVVCNVMFNIVQLQGGRLDPSTQKMFRWICVRFRHTNFLGILGLTRTSRVLPGGRIQCSHRCVQRSLAWSNVAKQRTLAARRCWVWWPPQQKCHEYCCALFYLMISRGVTRFILIYGR